jgi:hypothetical protein
MQLQDRVAVFEERLDSSMQECMDQLDKLNVSLAKKADSEHVATLAQLQEMRAELAAVPSSLRVNVASVSAEDKAEGNTVWSNVEGNKVEMKKMQVLIAAAGARFEKQLKDVRQQIQELKKQNPQAPDDGNSFGERWPGRVLNSPKAPSEDDDVTDDARSLSGSIADSMAYSVTGLSQEERAELKKMQTVVAAAGSAFSREMKAVKGQMHDLRGDVVKLKQQLGLPETVGPATPKATKPKAGKRQQEINEID